MSKERNANPGALAGATGAECKAEQLSAHYALKGTPLTTFYWHAEAHSVERLPAAGEVLG